MRTVREIAIVYHNPDWDWEKKSRDTVDLKKKKENEISNINLSKNADL